MWRKVSLGTALLLGSAVLGVWSGMGALEVIEAAFSALVAPKTLLLALVVSAILVLSHLMEKTGQMKRMLDAFHGISRRPGVNLTLFPALIGLLPMPGGAVFSAPMVDGMSKGQGLSAENKALVNYWFRHIWEYCWPLYPGVILATALSGISLATFMLVQSSLTLTAAVSGYIVLLRPMGLAPLPKDEAARPQWGPFVWELLPIAIVIAGTGLLGIAWPRLGPAMGIQYKPSAEVLMIISLFTAIIWTIFVNRVGRDLLRSVFVSKALGSMVYLIVGIMVFGGMLQASHTVDAIGRSFSQGGAPVALAAIALPFITGLVTGITVAFVGASFPILFSIMDAAGIRDAWLAYTVLAFAAGYVGVLASPVHACLVLTHSYFKADLAAVYRKLWLLCLIVFLAGILLYFVLKSMGAG